MMTNIDQVKKWTFRILVFTIIISLIYDFIWFFLQDLSSERPDDGGLERRVRSFSLTMSYISFVVKILLAIVFWKDSVDFVRIIKKRENMKDPRESKVSPDRKRKIYEKHVEEVVKEFE